MTTRVFIVELEVTERFFRTVAVRAETPEEAKLIAIEHEGHDDDDEESVQLDDDSEDQGVEVAAIVEPHEPTAEEMTEYAEELAPLLAGLEPIPGETI